MSEKVIEMLIKGIGETLYMTFGSVLVGYVIGLPLGILLYVTGNKGLRPNAVIYRFFDIIIKAQSS